MKKSRIIISILLVILIGISILILSKKNYLNNNYYKNIIWYSVNKENYYDGMLVSNLSWKGITLQFDDESVKICYDSEMIDCDIAKIERGEDTINMIYNDNLRLYGTIIIENNSLKIRMEPKEKGTIYINFAS